MVRQTLSGYIKAASMDDLINLFNAVITEMNKRKAKEQKVDVGFWDSEGNYKEDIQTVDISEMITDAEFDEEN